MQYILFVWLYNNRRFNGSLDPEQRFLSSISQNGRFPVYFVTCFAISTALYLLISLFLANAIGAAFAITATMAWFDDKHFLASAVVLNGVAIGFGGLLLSVCIGQTPISALLRSRWLRVLSVMSYSIYLTHLMLEPVSLSLTDRLFAGATPSALTRLLVFLPVYASCSLIAGMILHFLVEKPFLILKDRIRI